MRRCRAVVWLLTGTAACSLVDPEVSPNAALLPGPVEATLALGESRTLADGPVTLSFEDVLEDSRCPTDVVCVWAGNAEVVVGIAAGTGPATSLELNSYLEPRSATWNDLEVSLVEVAPEPVSGQAIAAEEYRIRVRVEPVG